MPVTNLAYLYRDSGYRFDEPTSLLYQVRIAINDAQLSSHAIRERIYDATHEYLDPKTIDNLMNGKTQRPQLRTVELIMLGLGHRLVFMKG